MTTALADSYKIWIGGVQVTDLNKDNISPAGKTAGTIMYDNTYKTLIFQNVTMTTDKCCIDVEMEGVDVKFEGTNTFTSTGANTFYANCPVKLRHYGETSATDAGNPRVTFNCTAPASGYYSALWFRSGGTLDIWGLYLTCTSNYYAIQGPDDASLYATLYSSGSEIKAESKNSSIAAIRRFSSAYSEGGKMEGGITYNKTNKRTEKADGSIANSVTWKNGIYICGRMVNAGATSRRDVKHPNMTGTVYYLNKELILDGVTYNGSDRFIENYNVENLKITCKGTNKITTSMNAILPRANTTITGTGSLSLTSTSSSAISTYNGANVTVNIDMLEAKGADYGFYGEQAGTLTLKRYGGSIYKFLGTNCNVYTGKLVMDDMDIWSQDTYFNASEHKMWRSDKGDVACGTNMASDATVFQSTSVFTYYPIFVAGTRVSDRNCNDIHNPYITYGKVSYNSTTKTLTLNSATIVERGSSNTYGDCGIVVTGEGVAINVVGTNNITAGNYGIYTTQDLTIGGSGNLNVTSTKYGALAMYDTGNERTLTLQCSGGTHSFKGKTYGFYGWNTANLAIKKASGGGALYKFAGETADIDKAKDLNLGEGVKIHSKCTWFNKEDNAMYRHNYISKNSDIDNGTWIRGDVEWIEYPLYICGEQLYGAIVGGQLKGSANGFCCKQYGGYGISYDPETQTLTMDGVTIDDTKVSNVVYNAGIDGLSINMTGDNNFKVADNIYKLDRTTTISGTGTVKGELAAIDGFGIYLSGNVNDDLVLYGPAFEFKGQEAIGGVGTNNVTIISPLTFEPNDYAVSALYKLSSVTFGEGLDINEPQGAYYSKSLKAVTTDGETVYKGKVVIDTPATPYDLTIAGVSVNSVNCKDILNDGVFSYNPETQTLTINGDCTYKGWIVDSKIDGLTINVSGNSTLTQQDNSNTIIKLENNTTITGGKLTLKSEAPEKDALGIYIYHKGSLTIRDASIEVEGDGFVYGISGSNIIPLVIDNSDITISAHKYGCICDWSSVTLTNCFVEQPRVSIIKPHGIYSTEDHIIGSGEETETLVIKAGKIKGDVNGDGDVNTADVTAVYGYIINGNLSGFAEEDANVNGDSDVNSADVVAIYSIIIGGSSGSQRVYEMLLEMEE